MFLHIYKYRLKAIFHTKDELFWILLFPILLGTCFYAGFSNITKSLEEFNTIPVAIVCEDDSNLTFFKAFIKALSRGDDAILSATYTDSDSATELLSNKDVTGIITIDNGVPALTIAESGINESVLKELMDTYIQSYDIINSVNPDDTKSLMRVISKLIENANYIINRSFTNGNTDYMIDYYYSLIAMTCLFGCYSGQSCAAGLKANLTPQGMRKCLSSTGRMTLILGDFFASCTFPVISNILLIIYLDYILKVDLGGNLSLIILTTVFGSIIGVCIGLLIGSIPSIKDSMKQSINTAISLFLSFLSGLMVGGIKYTIEETAPIINKINPATVITDALYSLNIYDTYERYIGCIGSLALMTAIMCILCFLMIRRESYASI